MKQEAKVVIEFFDDYATKIREIALELRTIVRSAMPDARETLDRSARIVGYGFGPGYTGVVCVIIPSKKGVNLALPEAQSCRIQKGCLKVRARCIATSHLPNAPIFDERG